MKIKKSHSGRARILWQASLVEGEPDILLLRENIRRLREENFRDGEFVLRALFERLRLYLRENRLRVFAPVELTAERFDTILKAEGGREAFSGGVEFVLDESLIGGIKIEKGFYIENFSIAGQLEQLKNTLIGS